SYDEMLELASLGAKVMQSRSVEFAKKFGVIFEVRSSLNDNPGTIVKEETRNMEDVLIRGVSLDKNQAKVTLVAVPDKPGIAGRMFETLAREGINIEMISTSEIKISVVIDLAKGEQAMKAVHAAFLS